ncbi:PRMT5-domain-containing protein [Phanerochaete sordida]|uniref:Protein arginine N-methyltransferase n=1 Tax=Phanerochaete sordida TaxID=48140 RepID=A0A9P3GLV4_9APHY|nr:PRMT5-domain-containing protein [Phanerochaete sordida]
MAAFVTHVTLDHLDRYAQPSAEDLSGKTPSQKATVQARAKGYDGICLPLTNDKWKARWRELCLVPADGSPDAAALEQSAENWRSKPVFLRDEVTITRLDEADNSIILLSDWLELDSADAWVRHDAEIALRQELAYATYLNVHTAILPPPHNREHVASYARTINSVLSTVPYMQLSVRMPIYDPSLIHLDYGSPNPTSTGTSTKLVDDHPSIATWEMWDTIRCICDYHPRLTLALDLTPPLPSSLDVLRQWVAEPTRHLFLPASTFIPNAKGYPVLPKSTQSFIREIMKLQPVVIFSGTDSGTHSKGGDAAYSQYVRHLEKTSPAVKAMQTEGTVEHFAQGYQDYLQAPLQPLMDNLQSITYQTFEQDPIKYRQYEEAVFQALSNWPTPGRVTLCVAGAGRGPLVARSLSAIKRANRECFVYAVEKNPNAFVTLQERKQNEWGDKVDLLFGDMRTLHVPEQVDILVSELLGSFGDNELSPECLDGAMRFLKPDGISIPASYTAYLAPISSSKLYNEARATKDEKSMETPYVVMLQSIKILSGDGGGLSGKCGPQIQECWEFEHPRRDAVVNAQGLPVTNSHNTRAARLTFHIPHGGALHGLAGYFEAVLYGNVGLSIHPQRMDKISKDMLSWFPLFFPFKEPLYLPSKSELQVSLWRLTNERQVWYEWYAEAFLALPDGSPLVSVTSPPPQRASLLAPAQLSSIEASPFVDNVEIPETPRSGRPDHEIIFGGASMRLVKIGQTSLHNPGGRSSWIGL